MLKYYRICRGLADKGTMVAEDEVYSYVKDYDKEWYVSVFYYNEEQAREFKTKGSVAGVRNVLTNKLIFDFDSATDLSLAQQDTLGLCEKLLSSGLKQDEFNICFSSNKGFSVEMFLTHDFTSKQIKDIAKSLAGTYKTWDTVVYNENRIFRYPYTKNLKSGLYKIPLTLAALSEMTPEEIKDRARDYSNGEEYHTEKVDLPEHLKVLDSATEAPIAFSNDFQRKVKWLPACKDAILQGFFLPGKRSNALMALCAALKAQGLEREISYRMLKGACELQARRYNQEAYSKDEIWNNIISVVYGPNWQGATYACKDHEFLQEICKITGSHQCKLREQQKSLVTIDSVANAFEKYASDIDKNTIKTGIDVIDNKIRLQTCSHVVLAGCSGSGKTTLILNILNKLSNAGLNGVFGSMDMNSNLIYQKLAHKVSGLNDKQLYALYQSGDRNKIIEINRLIYEEYKNILFDFRSGQSIEDLRVNLLQSKEKYGSNLKVVVLDFINRIRGPYSDETANLAYVAPRLSDLANETETMILSLAQTARHKGGPDTPLIDSRVSKGSSAIEESATVVFGIWRPGYNQGENDKYMCISALKTRMGKEFMENLYFNGLTGEVRGLNSDEQKQYEQFIDEKEGNKKEEDDRW